MSICFNCKVKIECVGKPLKELIKIKLPIFCSIKCRQEFPYPDTIEFKRRLKELEANKPFKKSLEGKTKNG